MKNGKNRTALLVRCGNDEAELIREAAKKEHRTINGYILNVVVSRIAHLEKVLKTAPESLRGKLLSE